MLTCWSCWSVCCSLLVVCRPVSKGWLCQGRKPEIEVRKPGTWSIHRKFDGSQCHFSKHISSDQEVCVQNGINIVHLLMLQSTVCMLWLLFLCQRSWSCCEAADTSQLLFYCNETTATHFYIYLFTHVHLGVNCILRCCTHCIIIDVLVFISDLLTRNHHTEWTNSAFISKKTESLAFCFRFWHVRACCSIGKHLCSLSPTVCNCRIK